jgi:hypothetical protein
MPALPKPLNAVQRDFSELCKKGGGQKGGPARGKVQTLLRNYGKHLNEYAHSETVEHLATYADFDPWHVCFAIGLSWGHLAKLDLDFTGAVVRLLREWNDDDLKTAKLFHMERGPDPIEQSLRGAQMLFSSVTLPKGSPETIKGYHDAQQRVLGRVIAKDRPKYIGSWNATAMFMVGLFGNKLLSDQLVSQDVLLPPGGPIFAGLSILYQSHLLSNKPAGSALDDSEFESGALYENNSLFAEIRKGLNDWSLLDVHSGLYLLGTRDVRSDKLTA